MSGKSLTLALPELDGPSAFLLVSFLDRLSAELWVLYGEEIFQEADLRPDSDQINELELRDGDLPF